MCEQVTYCTVPLRNKLFNSEDKFMHKGSNDVLIPTLHTVNKINVHPKGKCIPWRGGINPHDTGSFIVSKNCSDFSKQPLCEENYVFWFCAISRMIQFDFSLFRAFWQKNSLYGTEYSENHFRILESCIFLIFIEGCWYVHFVMILTRTVTIYTITHGQHPAEKICYCVVNQ